MTDVQLTCDLVIIVGDKDKRFFRLTLLALIKYWQPKNVSTLYLVTNKRNFKHIKTVLRKLRTLKTNNLNIALIDREKWGKSLPFYDQYKYDSYLSQRYLKLFSFAMLNSEYVWFVDSDYLLLEKMNEESLFKNSKFVWKYREWILDSTAHHAWGKSAVIMLGDQARFQFMFNTPYCFKVSDLKIASGLISETSIEYTGMGFSEFQFLGEFAFKNNLNWVDFDLIESSGVKSDKSLVHQDETDGKIDFTNIEAIDRAEGQKYLVFWSGFPNLAAQLVKTLRKHTLKVDGEFLSLLERVYKLDPLGFIARNQVSTELLRNFCFSDNWSGESIEMKIMPGRKVIVTFLLAPGASASLIHPTKSRVKLKIVDQVAEIEVPFLFQPVKLLLKFTSSFVEIPTGRILYAQLQK